MDEISSIKTFFESHNVHLSSAWLEGCVNWCREENLPPNYTLKDLQHKVFEQWLLLDLRDVEVPCLPPDLSDKIKYVLDGNYSLQMMKIIDISKPKYSQLQKIRNSSFQETEPATGSESSKRVLQLTLTDGVQEVEAMEYTPIPCLNVNLSPGIKIRLMGPITVRRGRLMLESKNVKVLGGEVEELIVPNAAENVLAAILKQPLNEKPNVIEESISTANKDLFKETGEDRPSTSTQNRPLPTSTKVIATPTVTNRSITNNPRQTTVPIIPQPSTSRQTAHRMIDAKEEEELRIAAEIEMMMEVETEFETAPSKKRKVNSKTPDLFDHMDVDDSIFENIDIPQFATDKTSEPKKVTSNENHGLITKSENNRQGTSNVHESLKWGDDFLDDFDVDAHLNQATKESEWKPSIPQKPLVLTIAKLLKNIPNISNGKFKIKAKYDSIVEKLNVTEDGYYLVIKVKDDTAELTAKLHSDIISDLAEYCPAALLSLKMRIMENNAEAENKVFQALRNIKGKLLQMNHVMEVQVNAKEKFPIIVNILK